MAGERTRRFTRSLLRPGQAAELRHSAASAAAVAVSSRQQQRVSVGRPPLLPARPGRHGAPSLASLSAQCVPSRVPSARQRHRRFLARGARAGGPGTLRNAERGRRRVWVWGLGRWRECLASHIGARLRGASDLGGRGVYGREPRCPQVCACPSPLATGAQRGRDVTLRSSLRLKLGAPR